MREADKLGGFDPNDYIKPDEKRSCDKKNHFLRSLHWQPNHMKHLKEVEANGTRTDKPQDSDKR
jgi:hypothetical protein